MPIIGQSILNATFYLYRTEQDAIDATKAGGSGFFVRIGSGPGLPEKSGWLYAVTNKHVLDAGCHVVRVNTTDGLSRPVATQPEAWTSVPEDDVAVLPFDISAGGFRIGMIDVDIFLKQDSWLLEVGDDAVLIGRLSTHAGKHRNKPIARFGSIAMMADDNEPIKIGTNPDGTDKTQVAFLVDCRSLSGASGSAVLGYRTPLRGNTMDVGGNGPYLLGIDCAHLPFWTRVYDKPGGSAHSEMWVESNSGIAVVIPAWRIQNVLYQNHLVQHRQEVEEKSQA
jgi:hypothetical protein